MQSMIPLSEITGAWLAARSDRIRPVTLTVNVTARCNLGCVFCEKGLEKTSEEIPFAVLKELLDLAKRLKMTVFLGGGEPFLHSEIWDILGYCRQIGKKVSVVTNGSLLTGLSPSRKELLNGTIGMMSISLDHPDPAVHDRLRGVPGTFDRVYSYLTDPFVSHHRGLSTVLDVDLANAAPMIQFAGQHGLPINFQPIIFESNYPGLEKAAWKMGVPAKMGLWAQKGREIKKLARQARMMGVASNLEMVSVFITDYYERAVSGPFFFDQILRRFLCFIPLTDITINERGELQPCALLGSGAGVHNGELLETWAGNALKYRDFFARGERFPVCRSCSCHFPKNFRLNTIAFPLTNRRLLPWFVRYYVTRAVKRLGRVQ